MGLRKRCNSNETWTRGTLLYHYVEGLYHSEEKSSRYLDLANHKV